MKKTDIRRTAVKLPDRRVSQHVMPVLAVPVIPLHAKSPMHPQLPYQLDVDWTM